MAIEIHFEKHINNLSLVREADTDRREYFGVACLFGAFLLCLLFYGWQHYQFIQNGYKIEAAQKKQQQLSEIATQLRLERASLRDPARIDDMARRYLGMTLPQPGQLVTFSADAPLTIPNLKAPENGEQLAAKR